MPFPFFSQGATAYIVTVLVWYWVGPCVHNITRPSSQL